MTVQEFGRVQIRIMNYLWEHKKASAREITRSLNEYEPIDHKNVQTILRRLENKGAVAHDTDGRTFYYYPLVKKETMKLKEVRNFIDRVFHGSVENLVSSLIDNDDISLDELKSIIEIIDNEEK